MEVVEAEIITPFKSMFDQARVFNMSDDMIADIANESERSRSRRQQVEAEIELLERSQKICEKERGLYMPGLDDSGDTAEPTDQMANGHDGDSSALDRSETQKPGTEDMEPDEVRSDCEYDGEDS